MRQHHADVIDDYRLHRGERSGNLLPEAGPQQALTRRNPLVDPEGIEPSISCLQGRRLPVRTTGPRPIYALGA